MLTLSASSASHLFAKACRAVLTHGTTTSPRGLETREVLGACLTLTNPRRRIVDVPPVRIMNPAFAAAEAVWILSGSDAPWIFEYNQRLARYADGGRLMGAYGPRLRRWHGHIDQLAQVKDKLSRDPATRQAVIQVFDPETDSSGHKDVPCTLGYRFFLRDGLLHMHTSMRSQDLWLGFCYDIFTATMLQELLAGWLGVGLGTYRLFADSLDLYARDVTAASSLPKTVPQSPLSLWLDAPWQGFDSLLGQVTSGDLPGSDAWAEIAGVMASYRTWKSGHREAAQKEAAALNGPLAAALCRWYQRLGQQQS